MQLFTGITNIRGERSLDVHVHIFELHRPLKLIVLDFLQDDSQASDDGVLLILSQYTLCCEHHGVSDRALNIVRREALIELNGGGEGFYEGIGRLRKTSGPKLFVAHAMSQTG